MEHPLHGSDPLPPAERPRVTPPWPRSPSCRTRNPHNVVGDVGILSSLGLNCTVRLSLANRRLPVVPKQILLN